jgi:hypothetical protein
MAGYPNPNYEDAPNYNVESGTNCQNAKPAFFWRGGDFCGDVNVEGTLTAKSFNLGGGEVSIEPGEYKKVLFKNPCDDKFYYVLASPLPDDFIPECPECPLFCR